MKHECLIQTIWELGVNTEPYQLTSPLTYFFVNTFLTTFCHFFLDLRSSQHLLDSLFWYYVLSTPLLLFFIIYIYDVYLYVILWRVNSRVYTFYRFTNDDTKLFYFDDTRLFMKTKKKINFCKLLRIWLLFMCHILRQVFIY